MGSSELSEYMAYYGIEPFGQWRDNWHFAQLTALMFNINAGKGKSVTTDEFMYRDAEAAKDRKDAEMIVRLNSMGIKK